MQVYDRRLATSDKVVSTITAGLPREQVLVGYGAANLGAGGSIRAK